MPEFDLTQLKAVFFNELASGAGDPKALEVGEARLNAILKRFYERMSGDILIGFFFVNQDLERIAQHQAAFLLRAMGVRPTYSGKPPATAHLALPPILSGHFDRRLRILEEVLGEFGLSPQAIRTWVEFEGLFRESIVAKN